MSWEDQGRQEHGWFRHGTAPPRLTDGDDEGASEGAGLVRLARDVRGGTGADLRRSLPPLMRPNPGSTLSAAAVLGTAILLNQLDRARGDSAVQRALKRFGLDPASSADVAAARAHVWARNFGPLNFDVPWSGAALDRFAEAAMRAERASPGTLVRALGGDRAAQAALGQLARGAKEESAASAPVVQPGSGIETRTEEERDLVACLQAQGKSAQEIERALENLRSKRDAVDAGRDRLRFQDWDKGERVPGGREAPGIATNGAPLPPATGPWLRGSEGNAGAVPGQVADKLRGRRFSSFDEFRAAFWKAVADTRPRRAENAGREGQARGDGEGRREGLGQATKEKPWLFAASISAAAPAAPVNAMTMSYEQWRGAKAALLRGQRASR